MCDYQRARATIERGAAHLRHVTNQDRYAGAGNPDTAYALASVLDMLALKTRDLDPELRALTERVTASWIDDSSNDEGEPPGDR